MGRSFDAAKELGSRAYAAQDYITAEMHFSEAISTANLNASKGPSPLELAKCHSTCSRADAAAAGQDAVDARVCTTCAIVGKRLFPVRPSACETNKLEEAKRALERSLELDPSSQRP